MAWTKDTLFIIGFHRFIENWSLHMDLLPLHRQLGAKVLGRGCLLDSLFSMSVLPCCWFNPCRFQLTLLLRQSFPLCSIVKTIPKLCGHVEFKSNDVCAVPGSVLFPLPLPFLMAWGSCIWDDSRCIKTSLLAMTTYLGVFLSSAHTWHFESSELSGFLQNYCAQLWVGHLTSPRGLRNWPVIAFLSILIWGKCISMISNPPRDLNIVQKIFYNWLYLEYLSSNLAFRKGSDEKRARMSCQRQKTFCEGEMFSTFPLKTQNA